MGLQDRVESSPPVPPLHSRSPQHPSLNPLRERFAYGALASWVRAARGAHVAVTIPQCLVSLSQGASDARGRAAQGGKQRGGACRARRAEDVQGTCLTWGERRKGGELSGGASSGGEVDVSREEGR